MRAWIFAALVMFAAAMSRESFAQTAQLRAGAAKVDVTPAENALPRNYEGILDRLYSRAIVIDSGVTSAAARLLGCRRGSRADLAERDATG